MVDAFATPPLPTNEPVASYAPGTPERAHDPSRVPGSPEQRLAAFHATLEQIRARTLAFVAGSRDLKTSAELGALARRLESHGTV